MKRPHCFEKPVRSLDRWKRRDLCLKWHSPRRKAIRRMSYTNNYKPLTRLPWGLTPGDLPLKRATSQLRLTHVMVGRGVSTMGGVEKLTFLQEFRKDAHASLLNCIIIAFSFNSWLLEKPILHRRVLEKRSWAEIVLLPPSSLEMVLKFAWNHDTAFYHATGKT